jgi:hypothetical protein
MHIYCDCFYLNESRCPAGRIPRSETVQAIKAKLAKDEKLLSQIIRAKQSSISTATLSGSQNSPEPILLASRVTVNLPYCGFTAATSVVYPLNDKFILDSGATIRVCNSCSHFQSLPVCNTKDVVYAGSEIMFMVRVRSVNITLSTGTDSRIFRLKNVAFILSFHYKVGSLSKFTASSVHWNTAVGQLLYNSYPFCNVTSYLGQLVLEFNPINSWIDKSFNSAFLTSSIGPQHKAVAMVEVWH